MAVDQQDVTGATLLAEGQELEKMAGGEHGELGAVLNGYLFVYVYSRNLGYLFDAQTSFDIPGLTGTRQPDVAYVSRERLPEMIRGNLPLAPDLAVEVVSPNDTVLDVTEKAHLYQRHGVGLVWVIEPYDRTVWVYRPNQPRQTLSISDELDGTPVLPGFRLPVRALFESDGELKRQLMAGLLNQS